MFAERNRTLDVGRLDRVGECEVVALIDPWARSGGEPPLPVRQAWLGALLQIHDAWHSTLLKHSRAFHLSLRLWEPHFCSSGVLAAVGDAAADAETSFPTSDGVRQSPPREYGEGLELKRYRWRGSELLWTDRLSDWDPADQPRIRRQATEVTWNHDGDFVVRRRLARVWVATAG